MMIKRLIRIIMGICIICTSLMFVSIVRADEIAINGVEVSFDCPDREYRSGQDIKTKVTVENKNSFDITNFSLSMYIPTGLTVKEPDQIPKNVTIKGNSKTTYDITIISESTEDAASNAHNWIWIVAIIGSVIIIALIVFFIIIKKKGKSTFAIIIIFAMLPIWKYAVVDTQAAVIERNIESLTAEIVVDGTTYNVQLGILFDFNELFGSLFIDTNDFSYNTEKKAYTVNGEIEGIKGHLDNSEDYDSIHLSIESSKGAVYLEQVINAAADWIFNQVGLLPGRNRLTVTALGKEQLTAEIYLIDYSGDNYLKLDNSEVDSDADGIYDLLEQSLGTDPFNADTDGDGLSDLQEVENIFTNPLLWDTDENGIRDSDEDCDGDGLSNLTEYTIGIYPQFEDSDFDGISDPDEITVYMTNPVLKDSDNDGANDEWELTNGYDPNGYDQSFYLTASTDIDYLDKPVDASVGLYTIGNEMDVESLDIKNVSSADNMFISPLMGGYLGQAYDFHFDGNFEQATISFSYDESLGQLSEDFQPRIYYYDETEKEFVELENQIVENGIVSANVTHFSTYVLRNKAEIDALHESAKELLGEANSLCGAEIVFAVDCSASMAWNDKNNYRKEIVQFFIDSLRNKIDRAAIINYTKNAEIACELTNDSEKLTIAANTIFQDNGLSSDSGTDSSIALYEALEMLKKGMSGSKYIFLLTDGTDNFSTYEYDQLIEEAVANNIVINVIDISGQKFLELRTIPQKTGGEIISLQGSSINIENTFGAFKDKVLLESVDSNNDGINDYFTKLIYEGKLSISCGDNYKLFEGINFNYDVDHQPEGEEYTDKEPEMSDDFDGDGLKNGEEIQIYVNSSAVMINVLSNPLMVHSDKDGISDYDEVLNGTDPMIYQVNGEACRKILDDDLYNCSQWAELYSNNYFFVKEVYYIGDSILNGVDWTDSRKRGIYKSAFIDYVINFGAEEKLEAYSDQWELSMVMDCLNSLIANGLSNSDKISLLGSISNIFDPDMIKRTDLIKEFFSKVSGMIENNPQLSFNVSTYAIGGKASDILEEAGETFEIVGNVLTVIDTAIEINESLKEIASVSANAMVFEEFVDFLSLIADYSRDLYAKAAAEEVLTIISSSFNKTLVEIRDTLETVGGAMIDSVMDAAIEELAALNPYVALIYYGIKVTAAILEELEGTGKMIIDSYNVCAYGRMEAAAGILIKKCITVEIEETGMFEAYNDQNNIRSVYVNNENIDKFEKMIKHLAQLRVLGEKAYCEMKISDGLLNSGLDSEEIAQIKETEDDFVMIKEAYDQMGVSLPLTKNIFDFNYSSSSGGGGGTYF